MYLLREVNQSVKNVIIESEGAKRSYMIEGIFAQSDKKNKNGRIYPKPIMEKEINRYIKEAVDTNRAFGELGHPDNPTINMPLVSHIITELAFDGSDVYGKAKIVDTPNGKIVKALLDEGASFGVSTRGLGTVQKQRDGTLVVQEDFVLGAVDIVADPSAPDAFVSGLVESKQWVWENGIIKEKELDEMKHQVLTATTNELNETFIKVFDSFLRKLSGR